MTPTTKHLLLVILTLLASGLGYAWVISQVDDTVPMKALVKSHASDLATAPATEPRVDTTTVTKPFETTTERQTQASPPTRLVGRIVDAEGEGLDNIKVRLRTTRGSGHRFILRQAMSDANGEFALDDLDPHSVYLFFIEAFDGYPGYRLDGFTLDSLPSPFEIRLERSELAAIEGMIVDAEHVPIANFTLTIENLDTHYPARTITSDDSGYFRVEGFPAGKMKIYTATPEYYRILGLRTRADEYRNLTLVIDRGHYKIEGRILDEHDQPIEAARVTLNSVIAGNDYQSHALRVQRSDASGNFEFTGLGGLAHTIGVYANGYKPHVENHEFQSFSDRLEVRLRR